MTTDGTTLAAASAGTIPGYGMEAGAGTIGAGAAAGTTGVMVTITFTATETSPITQAGVDIITVTI